MIMTKLNNLFLISFTEYTCFNLEIKVLWTCIRFCKDYPFISTCSCPNPSFLDLMLRLVICLSEEKINGKQKNNKHWSFIVSESCDHRYNLWPTIQFITFCIMLQILRSFVDNIVGGYMAANLNIITRRT